MVCATCNIDVQCHREEYLACRGDFVPLLSPILFCPQLRELWACCSDLDNLNSEQQNQFDTPGVVVKAHFAPFEIGQVSLDISCISSPQQN